MAEVIRSGRGRFGLSFEYKKGGRNGKWLKEEIFFSNSTDRDAAIKIIKRHPYNHRVRPLK